MILLREARNETFLMLSDRLIRLLVNPTYKTCVRFDMT
jgi:hypothetical protein